MFYSSVGFYPQDELFVKFVSANIQQLKRWCVIQFFERCVSFLYSCDESCRRSSMPHRRWQVFIGLNIILRCYKNY